MLMANHRVGGGFPGWLSLDSDSPFDAHFWIGREAESAPVSTTWDDAVAATGHDEGG